VGAANAGRGNSIVGRDKIEACRAWGASGCRRRIREWLERTGIAKTVFDEASGKDLLRGRSIYYSQGGFAD
jgi:hypothetical protein